MERSAGFWRIIARPTLSRIIWDSNKGDQESWSLKYEDWDCKALREHACRTARRCNTQYDSRISVGQSQISSDWRDQHLRFTKSTDFGKKSDGPRRRQSQQKRALWTHLQTTEMSEWRCAFDALRCTRAVTRHFRVRRMVTGRFLCILEWCVERSFGISSIIHFEELRTGNPIGWGVDAALHTKLEFVAPSLRGLAAASSWKLKKFRQTLSATSNKTRFDLRLMMWRCTLDLCWRSMPSESVKHSLLAIVINFWKYLIVATRDSSWQLEPRRLRTRERQGTA